MTELFCYLRSILCRLIVSFRFYHPHTEIYGFECVDIYIRPIIPISINKQTNKLTELRYLIITFPSNHFCYTQSSYLFNKTNCLSTCIKSEYIISRNG